MGLDCRTMYQRDDNARGGRGTPDGRLSAIAPEVRVRHAAARVLQALTDAVPGLTLDRPLLRAALGLEGTDSAQEGERCLALGWLHWLDGAAESAEPLLARSAALLPAKAPEAVQAAYWLARVRILGQRPEAVSAFEQVLRTLQGSPQATCWYVDLLWRVGRGDRAEQVWKPIRLNRRVTACEEAFLLEARALLRQGDATAAERTLTEAKPRGGVLQAERLLLLAWVLAGRRRFTEAQALLGQAQAGFYPAAALQTWQSLLRQRATGTTAETPVNGLPGPEARAWLEGQQSRARRADPAKTLAAFQSALNSPILRLHVRYALACLGHDDFTELLAELPGNFLAPRCRLWLTLARFCRREATAAELVSALRQAAAAGHGAVGISDWQSFAQALAGQPQPAELWPTATAENILTANRRRAAAEQAARQSPPEKGLECLALWGRSGELYQDEELRRFIGVQLLRLLLLRKDHGKGPATEEVLSEAGELLGSRVLPALVGGLLDPGRAGSAGSLSLSRPQGADTPHSPGLSLWQSAVALARQPEGVGESWRASVGSLRVGKAAALAQSLLVCAAARRGDPAAVVGLLVPAPFWRLLAGPPAFVVRALRSAGPGVIPLERWQQAVANWLRSWDADTLEPEARALSIQVGLSSPHPDTADPPPGADAAAWFLHQASQALGREDAGTALAWVRRALAGLPKEKAPLVQEALPELERLAQAQLLAEVARPDPRHPLAAPALFVDLRDLLLEMPEGPQLFAAVGRGEWDAARAFLYGLAARVDLPPRLAHHLALLHYRAARAFEEQDRDSAEPQWRLSWDCWLTWAAHPTTEPAARLRILDHLLGLHSRRLRDLLARNEVDRGRRTWELLAQPPLAAAEAERLGEMVSRRLELFREELATDYLLGTRQAMRHGSPAEGWRADYEQGLARLRRLLSLDRNNLRLLTALVEICGDWFLDLYDTQDTARMRIEVDRSTPFALQLARACAAVATGGQTWPGELAARAALSEFFKFRGYIADERERKRALYREALELNPANDNVRSLLADLEGKR